jgi:hypothetical protein
MKPVSFKDIKQQFGPDVPREPMLSREQRLTKYMPPVVTELLERRRLLALTVTPSGLTPSMVTPAPIRSVTTTTLTTPIW